MNLHSSKSCNVDSAVISQLMIAQIVMHSLPGAEKISQFFSKVIEDIPGVQNCFICIYGYDGPIGNLQLDCCKVCCEPAPDINIDLPKTCFHHHPDESALFLLETENLRFGHIIINVANPELFEPYHPFISNFSSFISIILENQRNEIILKSANEELQNHREILEQQVKARTIELDEAKKRAEAANIAKSQFLANMSHEIRTPVSIINGFADLLPSEEDPDEQKRYIELIQTAGRSLITLIDEILDISKIEAGKLDVKKSVCSINKLLNGIEILMRPLAIQDGLHFDVFRSADLPDYIMTDFDRVRQCLINLINNAIKFTQKGHVHLKVSVGKKQGETIIRFDVEDTGIGIPSDKQKSIFDLFSQVDSSHSRLNVGTGLGLAISKRLSVLLGGDISLTSQINKGSVFSLFIPLGMELNRSEFSDKATKGKLDKPGSLQDLKFNARVLLAEDNEGCQILTTRILKRYGIEAVTATNGKDAVIKAQLEDFDMIFMDMQMPYLNGYEAAAKLKEEGINTPIIALTAYAMQGDKDKCIKAGCDDYLSKPIAHEELLRVLNKYAKG